MIKAGLIPREDWREKKKYNLFLTKDGKYTTQLMTTLVD